MWLVKTPQKIDNFLFVCLNSNKQWGPQNTIKKLVVDDDEITDQTHILEHIRQFNETLFKKRQQKIVIEMRNFFCKSRKIFVRNI